MPRYNYIAKTQPNKSIQGNIEAETKQEAINKLAKMGYFPVSLESEDLLAQGQAMSGRRKIKKKELVLFTEQLSSLVGSGVNILNGLNTIANQATNKYLRAVLNDVSARIKDGQSLSDSLSSYPDIFTNLYSSLIRTGETSGALDKTLKRLADFMGREDEFRNSLRASLTYPFFVLSVGILTVAVLLTFVIPRLVTMFEDMGEVLPLPTRILINSSDFLRSYWFFIIIVLFIIIFILQRINADAHGRIFIDRLKLKIPVLGVIILKTEISRLSRTLSLLLSSGVPVTYSLDISSSIIENQVLRQEVEGFKEGIAGGLSLSGVLKESRFFPEFVINIISIGEETGALDVSLLRIADDYEKEVDRALKALTRLLEPVIILAMGLVVGFIVLSMLLPIFQINLIVR